MRYSEILEKGISSNDLTLAKVCLRLAQEGIWVDRAILSKLRNGKIPPAKDSVNIVLARVIGINAAELRLAAAREVIDPELYELIRSASH